MSEIKTKIRTYNDVVDLFGEEKAADMLSEALDWSTIDPKNDKKNIMERKPLLLDPYMTYVARIPASISSPDSSVTATSTGRADISTRRKSRTDR